jgi:3-mercaptopyruvate sulfurtransferase SseA
MPSTNQIIAASLVLLLGLGLIFLPDKDNHREVQPLDLLEEMQNDKRFITVDQLTEKMIQQDPTLLLVDVRDTASFARFSLPGAINIPFDQLMNPDYDDYFNRKELDIVLYSNDHILAERAWMIKKRQNIHHVRILKGGLNQWTKDILLAEPPPETAPAEAFARYSFLLGARKQFVGASGPFEPAADAE